MKVNIGIDCTPLEARQFIGLPDMMPIQTAIMDKLQQQMTSNLDKISPEAVMQTGLASIRRSLSACRICS
jgi:pyrrolidone-carboxylate peptidase